MTILKLSLVSFLLTLPQFINAQEYSFVGTDNSLTTKFCVFAGANNTGKLKATLRRMGIHDRKLHVNSIRCNDDSPAKFAYQYGAIDTFTFLNQHSFGKNKVRPSVTISDVAKLEPVGKAKIIYVSAKN